MTGEMLEEEVYQYNTTPFYKALQTRYTRQFEIIQEQSGLICCPLRNINDNDVQNPTFILKHFFIPSSFFKNQYISLNSQESDILVIENNSCMIILNRLHKKKEKIRVLGEQIGYTINQKTYKIFVIEYPIFDLKTKHEAILSSKCKSQEFSICCLFELESSINYLHKLSPSLSDNLIFFVKIFNRTYVPLIQYFKTYIEEIYKIYENYVRKFQYLITSNDDFLIIAIESCLIGSLYNTVWSLVIDINKEKDSFLDFKLKQISENIENGNISYYLKLNNRYLIDYQLSVKEIMRIHLLSTAFEKLACMKTCLDLISTELALFYKINDSENKVNEHDIKLTSDELLPLTCYILTKAKLNYLHSLIFFIDEFNFTASYALSHSLYLSSVNEFSFVLSTFKAATDLIEHYV